MAQTLSWNLHGNDQLSAVLERLDRTLGGLSRKIDATTADAKRMGAAFGAAEPAMGRMVSGAQRATSHMEVFGSGIERVIDKVRYFGIAMSTMALAAAGSMGFLAVKTASANESAAISFELMLGSADKAKKFFEELQAFAAATPFELPQLRDAASRLLAVGTNVKDVIPLMRALGDATAGMGTGAEGIARAVYALQQMQQKTKVTGEEMMQLTEAGIPAWQTLADFLRVDVATAMKMVERRAVDATAIFQAIETKAGPAMQRLSGMMERQSHTLEGVWSTFKDNASQALAKFAEPLLPGMKRIIDVAGQVTPKVLDKIRDMGRQIGDIFKGSDVPGRIFDSLKTLGEKILPTLEKSWGKIVKTIEDNKEGLEKFGRFLADFVIPIVGGTLVVSIDVLTAAMQALIFVVSKVADAFQFMGQVAISTVGLTIHGMDAALGGFVPGLHKSRLAFDEWAQNMLDKLAALDHASQTFSNSLLGAIAAGAAGGAKPRAVGGPVWAGGLYTKDEFGPEPFLAATTGTVQPANRAGGGQTGDAFQLELTLRSEDGQALYEKLLNFRANSGKVSLAL